MAVSIGPVRVLLTDGRSFHRNPESKTGQPQLFGAAQLAWLENELLCPQRNTSVIVVASGTQVLAGSDKDESLADFPEEQTRILGLLQASPVPVVVVSGDRHYGEILRRNNIIELSASPLSGSVFRTGSNVADEPYRQKVVTGINTMGLLRASVKNGKIRLRGALIGPKGETLGKVEIPSSRS